ncbi:N-succinyl-L-Arg/Lys racemase (N-succinyl amino acid racemase) (NSAR) [Durusdinium trenchii]|uniref:N-succinyl-L-Arg/Lys racemase (N-succinyl amino acid racemase) (NSAR) n=1 Tax=Durusdinium trenchii TaxID=1381693 RepID=A0ABP0IGE4_9DINO
MLNRRQFLAASAGATLTTWSLMSRQLLQAADSLPSERHFHVRDIQRTTLRLEFRPTPRRNMDREIPHWRWAEVCEVTLESGAVGFGETLLFYTWGVPSDDDVARVRGQSAIEMMWDDSLGAGLQMALFDAVARTAHVPVHSLLGHKHTSRTPLSWWNIDTSAEDMASECAEAYRQGYMSYKTTGRPWFDLKQQLDLATKEVPEDFMIDMDFNDTLLTAEQGLPILKDLERYPQVDIFETPIPQKDVAGNRAICAATDINVALHYGTPDPATVVRESAADGFVVGHGAEALMSAGRFAEEVEMPFWLQLVGSDITAAWSLHFGGVLKQALWPAVNCHQLYEERLLIDPITVSDGHAEVPDRIGLGYELNRDAVERFKVQKPAQRPEPQRLIETTWPDGRTMYTASNGTVNFMLHAAMEGKYPYFEAGADTRLVPDDGSSRWKELYKRARKEGPISV